MALIKESPQSRLKAILDLVKGKNRHASAFEKQKGREQTEGCRGKSAMAEAFFHERALGFA